MSLLDCENINFKYTDKELYNNCNFRILEGEHIVLVGPNGCGKSTFMNICAKNIIPDSGKVTWLPNVKYSYLDQQLKVDKDVSIFEYLYGVFKPLFDKEAEMNKLYDSLAYADVSKMDKIMNRAQAIQDELDKENFYAINSKIGNIINGLGVSNYGLDTKLSNLSGGQREKVYLAKMLLEESDVLLMDEPTNFLDREHILWLIDYLNSFKGAFLVISHDVEFAKAIARVVYEINNKQLVRYKGDYEFYLKEHDLRNEQMLREYENQQKYIKNTEDWIKAHIVRATSSRQAKERQRRLDRLEVLEKPQEDLKISIHFPFSGQTGEEVLKLNNLEVGYYGKAILPPLNLLIEKEKKVAILGHNGVGKTTILKTIMGNLAPISGSYKFNNSAVINFFEQEHVFPKGQNAVNYLRSFYPLKEDGELRSVLARCGIKGELALKDMNQMSGGEQTRVRIALMTMKKSNVLILDEPTNHLDKITKESLFKAIDEFPGSVILVSHEKDFYDDLLDYEINFD
ncbi:MAG: ATP-binding cassette domain-containing protein [Acholeplasmatales bacterium]|nr:ATP-binding cassette domain-containing protein [Acholeplasmatales bacterium]